MKLSEQRRTQLDGIVKQMIANKESDNTIRFVVDDFKKKYGEAEPLQEKQKSMLRKVGDFFTKSEQALGNTFGDAIAVNTKDYKGAMQSQADLDDYNVKLVQMITDNKKAGKDTSRLEQQYKKNTGRVFKAEEITPSINKSAKQIYGEGLGVITDMASFGRFTEPVKGAMGAKTAGQAFLRGALNEVPEATAMGASFATSEAMQKNKSGIEILKDAEQGAVTGGLIGGLLGGITAKGNFSKPQRAEALKQKAIAQYKKGLQATKEKYKEKTEKIVPELLDKQWWGTRKKLLAKAEKGINLAEADYQKLGELKGVAEIGGIVNNIDDEVGKLTLASGRVSSVNSGRVKALKELKADILAVDAMDKIDDGIASMQKLRELAGDYGKEVYETRRAQKTITDNKTLSQVKKVDSWIRELLNKDPRNLKYSEINKTFHLNSELAEVLEETAFRKEGHKVLNVVRGLTSSGGLTSGAIVGGLPGAVIGGLGLTALGEIANSTWWNTMRAVQKNNFADKLLQQSTEEMSSLLTIFAKQGIKAVEDYLNE